MNSLQQLIGWLNDAYVMERRQTKTLATHANDAIDLPEIRDQDKKHLAETRRHADLVGQCLGLLGEKPAPLKSTAEESAAPSPNPNGTVERDQIVRNFIADYAAEHQEIASYRSLIAAAAAVDQPEIARICGEILREEQSMAEWLEELIPEITRLTLLEVAVRE